MSLLLFYDTETSDMIKWTEPSSNPAQPHIVQIAAVLVDSETRKTQASIDLTVRPRGWVIEPGAQDVHGISVEQAYRVGVSEEIAVSVFLRLWDVCDTRIGHEESFDARILRIAMKRFDYGIGYVDRFKESPAYCTCTEGRDACKIPSKAGKAGNAGFKKPKLTEAYTHFFGNDYPNAHTALADVNATIAVYWAIKDKTRGFRRQTEKTT